jgi:hypothetical protein
VPLRQRKEIQELLRQDGVAPTQRRSWRRISDRARAVVIPFVVIIVVKRGAGPQFCMADLTAEIRHAT